MIVKKSAKAIGFLKTTAIGGLLFLLPLIVLGALIGQVAPIVLTVAETLGEYIPVKTPSGIAFLLALSIVIVLFLCFVAGLLARWSLGQRITAAFEKNLLLLFPRYAILKDQMADTIGGEQTKPQMKPVLVRFDDSWRIGFETERGEDAQRVTVYLPGSPDPWAGKVVLLEPNRVESLAAEFGDTVATCEQLGRGSARLIKE